MDSWVFVSGGSACPPPPRPWLKSQQPIWGAAQPSPSPVCLWGLQSAPASPGVAERCLPGPPPVVSRILWPGQRLGIFQGPPQGARRSQGWKDVEQMLGLGGRALSLLGCREHATVGTLVCRLR